MDMRWRVTGLGGRGDVGIRGGGEDDRGGSGDGGGGAGREGV